MAKAIINPKLDLQIQFTINESEARALDALAGYGDEAFIKHFYEKLGEAYMKKHEEGLRTFLQTIRSVVSPGFLLIDRARDALKPQSEDRGLR